MQRLVYQSGLTPGEFWDCTLNEALLVIQGYRLRTREWQYFHYQLNTPLEKQVPIYRFWKMPGDPTLEEQQKMMEDEMIETQRLYEEGQRIGLDWVKEYQQKGMLN